MAEKYNMSPNTLASYALLKALTDSKEYNNQYEILAEFIRYIISERKLREFYLIEIQNYLMEEFSFTIPQAAIKTSIKHIKECKKSGERYVIDNTVIDIKGFSDIQNNTIQMNQKIIEKLYEYALQEDKDISKDVLEDVFIKYIIDDSLNTNAKYTEIISKFLILNEEEKDFQRQISEIREGSILYCGLTYNMTELGSIRDYLTLFLDTEVLFNIVGYNGEFYQTLTQDLLTQIKTANKGQQRIKLRYFQEVRQEIEGFFKSAEYAVLGKGELIQNTAMRAIINGCGSVSDVRNKQADFFNKLQYTFGIIQDEKTDYYSEEDYKYNIESIPIGFDNDEKTNEAVKFISHINKLRKGINGEDYTKCKYLLVTETKRIQEISNVLRKGNSCCYALPTSVITNILWFKLGCGFSKKDYPANVNASYKARGIISGILSSAVSQAYEEIKRDYCEGKLTKEQVADRIVMLRDKTPLPDRIKSDNLDELLDFSSEAVDKYEQGIKANVIKIEEQKKIITQLAEQNEAGLDENARLKNDLSRISDEVKQKDEEIIQKDEHIVAQNQLIESKEAELEYYREEERKRNEAKLKKSKIFKFILEVVIKFVVFIIVVIVLTKLLKKFAPELNDGIGYCIDAVGIVLFIVSTISSTKKKIYDNDKDDKKTGTEKE